MDKVAANLGFIKIYWYSVFIFVGLFCGLWYIFSETKRTNEDEEEITNLIFNLFVTGIIGARLYYVIFNFNYYRARPLEIFEIWNGGLAIHGAILAGIIYIVVKRKKINTRLFKVTDLLAGGLLIGQAVGRWGNFFNQEAFGKVIERANISFLPDFIVDNMLISGAYRQPLFLYESLMLLFGFVIVFLVLRRRIHLRIGVITSFYLFWYGLIRVIIEPFRADSLYLGNIRVAILVSILMIISSVIVYKKSQSGMRLEKLYNN